MIKKRKKKHRFDWLFPLIFTLPGLAFFCPGAYLAVKEYEFREHATAYRGFLANVDFFHTMRSHNHPPVLVRYVKPDGEADSTFVKQHYNSQYRRGDSLPLLINESLGRAEVGGRSAWLLPVLLMFIGTVFIAGAGLFLYFILTR
jgi:hypothetical protein